MPPRDTSPRKRARSRRKLLVTGALSTSTLLGACGGSQVLSNPKGSHYDEDAGVTAPATDAGAPTGDVDDGGAAKPLPEPK